MRHIEPNVSNQTDGKCYMFGGDTRSDIASMTQCRREIPENTDRQEMTTNVEEL